MKHITMFDRQSPKEKQMEGLAISQMIVSGACFKCRYYKRCSTDERFSFPSDSACMRRKSELMKEADHG